MKSRGEAETRLGFQLIARAKPFLAAWLLLVSLGVLARNRPDPELDWKETQNSRFIVVFPAGYESQAVDIAATALQQYNRLVALWNVSINEKIRLLLAPDSDVAGGSIFLFPYPAIRIDLAPPSPDSRLSGGEEPWLDKVLAHELTRLLLITKSSSFLKALRRMIGPIPFTFPMLQYPSWLHEGLAIYSESLICPSGRLNTPDYRRMFQHIAAEGGFQDFLSLRGSPSRWPGPVTRFLYGAELFRFLAERYGRESLQQLVEHLSRVPISLGISLRFQHVFHMRLKKIWRQFGIAASRAEKSDLCLQPLTRDGWIKQYPEVLNPDRLAWVFNNYRSRPGIRVLDRKSGQVKWILRRWGISSLAYDKHHNRLFYSAPEVFRSFRRVSDIYSWLPESNESLRWSRGKSLFHPHPFPDGSGLVCICRNQDKFRLARLDAPMAEPRLLSTEFIGLAHPRVSPDGNQVAVAIKLRDMNWGIALFTPTGEMKFIIRIAGKRCSVPRWLDSQRLAFVLSGRKSSTAAIADLSSRKVQVIPGPGSAEIRYLAALDQDSLLAVFLNAGGEDLAVIPIVEIRQELAGTEWISPSAHPGPETVNSGRRYNKWRELAPRFISPDAGYVEKEVQFGAQVGARDLPGRHEYRARALYGLKTRRWNTDLSLMVGTLHPRIILTWRNEHLVLENRILGDFIQTNTFLNLEAQFPLVVRRHYRWDLGLGVHVNRIADRSFLHAPDESVNLNGFTLTLLSESDQRYYDAFTRTDGGRFLLTASWDLGLGNSSAVQSLALDWRRYISLRHPNVLAIRLAAAHSWGTAPRLFYMGGARAPGRTGLIEGGLFSLLRGYPAGYSSGFGGWQLNIETRLQIMKIERALPVGPSFQRLYMSLFCDIGNTWTERLHISPMVSWGAEMGMLLHMGGSMEVALGMAVSRSLPANPTIYFRIGESF